jgi:hypothetical protein
MMAVDMDNKKIWWGKVGTGWFNSGDPAAGNNAAFTDLATSLTVWVISTGTAGQITAKFKAMDWVGSPPSGFFPWPTA